MKETVDELPKPPAIKLAAGIVPSKGEPDLPQEKPGVFNSELKLDLGCGQSPRDGFEGVDLYAANSKHKVDLFRFPWPWADNTVDELNCSHFIEHIPMVYLCKDHGFENLPCEGAQDLFFAFFDECYRILKPQGKMHIVVPACRSERSFQDPTHRRFIAQATFFYLWKNWRDANKLDHYNVKCNFQGDVNFSFPIEFQSRHEEVQRKAFSSEWNAILDYIVVLRALK